jgi:hypothetical protein
MMLMARQATSGPGPSYRILFSIYSWYYFRQMRPVIEALARDGHMVHVVSILHDRDDFKASIDEVCEAYPTVSYQVGPERKDEWTERAEVLRQSQSFVQSQDARFNDACRYADTARLRGRHPQVLDKPFLRTTLGRELAWRALKRLNDALPTDPKIDAVFASFKPDVLVITPLIDRGGEMWDFMASARQAGVRTVFPVHSWDNLSSKSRINWLPDRVLVWNETQVEEAKNFHHIPRRRITVTGAQGFDEWFSMKPTVSREEFCRELGLNPHRPILLYVCSAILKRHVAFEVASDGNTELAYFTRWITALRASDDPRLREANVIIRPHPKREQRWDDIDLSAWGRVVVHPRHGRLPNNRDSKAIFFDSLFHSEAIVGISTSAMIEAGIVGKAAMTVLDPDYAPGQVEMQHFQYLLKVGGGLLIAADTYAEHVEQLKHQLDHPTEAASRIASFIDAFVRPLGRELAATPLAAEAVLTVAAKGPRRPRARNFIDRILERKLAGWVPQERAIAPQHWGDMPPDELRRRLARKQARRDARDKKEIEPAEMRGAR